MTKACRFEVAVRPVLDALKACSLIGVIVFSPARAQQIPQGTEPAPQIEMKDPRVSFATVDWKAMRATLASLNAPTNNAPADAPQPDALAQLNAATGKVLPNIADSAIPVLLPFDTAAFLRDRIQGTADATSKYSSGFNQTFFSPGPSGYDAMLTLQPKDNPGLHSTYVRPVSVQISGSTLVYDLDGPSVQDGAPVPELDNAFPGIRRVLLESHVRYTFVRFGVPYFVSIECFDGPNRARRLSCLEADKVAVRVLDALNVVGGKPQSDATATAPQTIARPQQISPDFTYYAPGDLLPGSDMKGEGGRADSTVYSRMRFPMARAPDYVNSQTFMNWGNCDFTGRVSLGGRGTQAAYRCKVNDKPLVQDESKNYAYPWRDNFCEHRYYYVTQCPSGLGHQGQDIRPSTCLFRTDGSGRCEAYQDDIVAVRTGVLMRAPGDEALYLIVNERGEHLRFRYLHMDPHQLDAAGMINGREVSEGEVIGAVGNYGRRSGGTSYHVHFDVQVPTRQGWVFVNPYMTLVAAYEHLIGGRGQVVRDTHASIASTAPPAAEAQRVPNSAVLPAAKPAEAPKPTPPAAEAQRVPILALLPEPRPAEAPKPAPPAAEAQGIPSPAVVPDPKPVKAPKPAPIEAVVKTRLDPDARMDSVLRIATDPAEPRIIAASRCTTRLVRGGRRRVCQSVIARTHARADY